MLEFLLKSLSPQLLALVVTIISAKLGNYFKNKDKDRCRPDDAFGNVLIDLLPAIAAIVRRIAVLRIKPERLHKPQANYRRTLAPPSIAAIAGARS